MKLTHANEFMTTSKLFASFYRQKMIEFGKLVWVIDYENDSGGIRRIYQ